LSVPNLDTQLLDELGKLAQKPNGITQGEVNVILFRSLKNTVEFQHETHGDVKSLLANQAEIKTSVEKLASMASRTGPHCEDCAAVPKPVWWVIKKPRLLATTLGVLLVATVVATIIFANPALTPMLLEIAKAVRGK